MCGEKAGKNVSISLPLGSPPRVRGKVLVQIQLCTFIRITPACAGKSFWLDFLEYKTEDHPRVCGEKSTSLI